SCPGKAPEWFIHAQEQLTKQSLGGHFNAVLAAWTRIEAACAFATPSHKLSTKGRLDHMARWIAGACGRRSAVPVVTNPMRYAKEWWGWWDSLQLEWRVKGDDGVWITSESYGGEWDDELMHWGPNGTLSVVAALYFWGCAVVNSQELREAWEVAVNDVAWILE
ncbi:hypothetical protein FB451DRAFT_1002730, partial [Mycena latifolia]